MNVGMTCEECQKDEVGRGLPPHRLAAGEGDEADEHDAQAGPVHPHVPLHVPAHTSILVKHHYLSYMQCCGAGPFSSGSGYFFASPAPALINSRLSTSVVDPNTLNLDQDPGFWPNLDPG